MNLKKIGKVFRSKFVGTGPSFCKKEFTGPRSHKGWETLGYTILTVRIMFALMMDNPFPAWQRKLTRILLTDLSMYYCKS